MKPTSIALTRMPCAAPSPARTLVSAIPAARVTEVGALAGRRLVEGPAPPRHDGDIGAGFRELLGDRKAQSQASAGYQRFSALESDLHACVPFFRGGEDYSRLGTGAGPSGFPGLPLPRRPA